MPNVDRIWRISSLERGFISKTIGSDVGKGMVDSEVECVAWLMFLPITNRLNINPRGGHVTSIC